MWGKQFHRGRVYMDNTFLNQNSTIPGKVIFLTVSVLVAGLLTVPMNSVAAQGTVRVLFPARITTTYTLGSTHNDIKAAQILLNQTLCPVTTASANAGSQTRETEYFGGQTEQAVRCFQRFIGQAATGSITPALYSALLAAVQNGTAAPGAAGTQPIQQPIQQPVQEEQPRAEPAPIAPQVTIPREPITITPPDPAPSPPNTTNSYTAPQLEIRQPEPEPVAERREAAEPTDRQEPVNREYERYYTPPSDPIPLQAVRRTNQFAAPALPFAPIFFEPPAPVITNTTPQPPERTEQERPRAPVVSEQAQPEPQERPIAPVFSQQTQPQPQQFVGNAPQQNVVYLEIPITYAPGTASIVPVQPDATPFAPRQQRYTSGRITDTLSAPVAPMLPEPILPVTTYTPPQPIEREEPEPRSAPEQLIAPTLPAPTPAPTLPAPTLPEPPQSEPAHLTAPMLPAPTLPAPSLQPLQTQPENTNIIYLEVPSGLYN